MTEKQKVPMFIILTPSGFEELHKHTFTMQNPLYWWSRRLYGIPIEPAVFTGVTEICFIRSPIRSPGL